MSVSNHRVTWTEFLKTLIMISYSDIDLLAETLSICAPQGPLGFKCRDAGCDCGEIAMRGAARIFGALMDVDVPVVDSRVALDKLRAAIDVDVSGRKDRFEMPIGDLATRHRVIVSTGNGDVAHARRMYPHTWRAIETIVRPK